MHINLCYSTLTSIVYIHSNYTRIIYKVTSVSNCRKFIIKTKSLTRFELRLALHFFFLETKINILLKYILKISGSSSTNLIEIIQTFLTFVGRWFSLKYPFFKGSFPSINNAAMTGAGRRTMTDNLSISLDISIVSETNKLCPRKLLPWGTKLRSGLFHGNAKSGQRNNIHNIAAQIKILQTEIKW